MEQQLLERLTAALTAFAPKVVYCEACDFWDPYGDRQAGLCRRHPPVKVLDGDEMLWQVPETHAGDFCGDGIEAAHKNSR